MGMVKGTVEVVLPVKQGLKQADVSTLEASCPYVEVVLPVKQGLKHYVGNE